MLGGAAAGLRRGCGGAAARACWLALGASARERFSGSLTVVLYSGLNGNDVFNFSYFWMFILDLYVLISPYNLIFSFSSMT